MPSCLDQFRARLQAPGTLAVRETYWGYTIETPAQLPRHYLLNNRAMALMAFYVFWLVVLAIWLSVMAVLLSTPMTPGYVVLWCAVAFALWRLLTRQVGIGHVVQVDLSREMLRIGARCGDRQDDSCRHVAFTDISEIVMERPRDAGPGCALKLRLKEAGPLVLIATGTENDLLALHDRLARDVTPIEERVAFQRLPKTRAARPVFPPLGPAEVLA